MKKSAFTWVGLAIVALGWAVLIADLAVSDTILRAGNLVAVMALRSDILTVAQTAIVTGFGLAIIGALRSGFGAFSRFFDAVLQRSTTPRAQPMPQPMAATPSPERPDDSAPIVTITPPPTAPRQPKPAAPPPPPARDRNYIILADGSVEVETMFGTRVFATLDEARDFIR